MSTSTKSPDRRTRERVRAGVPKAAQTAAGAGRPRSELGDSGGKARVIPTRDSLILRVTELAKKLHRQPNHKEMRDVALIREDDCRRIFGGYSSLLRAAGFRGQVRGNQKDSARRDEMLDDYGRAIGRLGRFPSIGEYTDHGLFSYHTFKTTFGSWPATRTAYVDRTGGSEQWSATLRKLIEQKNVAVYNPHPDFPICGKPLNYRAMLHEPTNEQGVVLLFGMMAEEIGFIIENVRTSYPDCEGKRRVGVNSWQRVRIEFEFLSSRFAHPEEGCDLVVCWRHDNPKLKVEVMELEKVIRERKEMFAAGGKKRE
ncbi:MAG: hypothetical protein JNM86_13330 [Phycisphaerae bacterium]|nr:hypothetical protein [Phycisphaerae bacterium]